MTNGSDKVNSNLSEDNSGENNELDIKYELHVLESSTRDDGGVINVEELNKDNDVSVYDVTELLNSKVIKNTIHSGSETGNTKAEATAEHIPVVCIDDVFMVITPITR